MAKVEIMQKYIKRRRQTSVELMILNITNAMEILAVVRLIMPNGWNHPVQLQDCGDIGNVEIVEMPGASVGSAQAGQDPKDGDKKLTFTVGGFGGRV